MDHLLSKPLLDYITAVSSNEPPLLKNLRAKATATLGIDMTCGPLVGGLLHLLVKLQRAATCLELGTFAGYSALQIASALGQDGKLITCEVEPKHADFAQRFFDQSPHGHKIFLKRDEAKQTIAQLQDKFDFIFIDADKANYPEYYDLLVPKLKPNGLMVVDNALWKGEVVSPENRRAMAIDTLNRKASEDARVQTLMLPIRDGLLLIYNRHA